MRVISAEGNIAAAKGDWTAAAASHSKALEKAKAIGLGQSETARYKVDLGLAANKSNDKATYDKMVSELNCCPKDKKRLEKAAQDAAASNYLRLASGYMQVSDYDKALEFVKKAIEKNDNPALTYKMEGSIHAKMGQFTSAITSLSKAAEAEKDDKNRSKIYQTLIKLQLNNKDYSGAKTSATKLLEKNDKDPDLHFIKAQACYLLQQYPDAISETEKAISLLTPKDDPKKKSKYYFLQGIASKKSGDNAKAKLAFDRVTSGTFAAAAKNEIATMSSK